MYRLGIDVDGVNTYCVVMSQNLQVICKAQLPTTDDVLTGIEQIVRHVLQHAGLHPSQIKAVIIGTSQGYKALLDHQNLAGVITIRLGTSKGSIPPLYEADQSLQQAIRLRYVELPGGHMVDGTPYPMENSRSLLEQFLRGVSVNPDDAFAIASTFSPMNGDHERQVAAWIKQLCGTHVSLTMSHEIGNIGFLERENTAVLNAALARSMRQTLCGLTELFQCLGVSAGIFLTQNNGSVMSHTYALRYPIRTLCSRACNSFRGAAFLAGRNDCVMVNVEENLTHIGIWKKGFPKLIGVGRKIAGIPVNLQMPEISTLDWGAKREVDDDALDRIYQAIQRYQPRFEPLPILFTGEGSEKVVPLFKYPWADVVQTDHTAYVSAIGACIAPISGHVDRMYWLNENNGRDEAIALAKEEAVKEAVLAGANPETVNIQAIEAAPLSYIPCQALRIQVRATGLIEPNGPFR
jgi:N-methylhydantoinase A/oxoprolinase/acetone carboxylase beta subunit